VKNSIKKILYSKWEFKEPPQSDVLIYDADRPFSQNLEKILKKNTYQFFYTRGEVLNLPILFRTLITTGIKKIRFNYKKNIVKSINPKFVITQNHSDIGLYDFKKYDGDFKIIIIQSSVYAVKFFKKNINSRKLFKNSIDYFFTFGNLISKKLKKYLTETKFFSYGSFKNNAYSSKKISRKGKILFLSSWKVLYKFPEFEKIILQLLENYCKIKNLKLVISTRFSKTKYISEMNKFLNYKDHKFEIRKSDFSVYESICSYDLIVFCSQTAGYEALSRGKKVLSFSPTQQKYNRRFPKARTFMNEVDKKVKGAFWTNNPSKREIFKKIDFISKLNKKSWNKLLQKEFKNYVIYNKNNRLLIKKLYEIGVPVKK